MLAANQPLEDNILGSVSSELRKETFQVDCIKCFASIKGNVLLSNADETWLTSCNKACSVAYFFQKQF